MAATWEEPERYRGPVLAERLLTEAQAQMPDQPREARTFLRLARTVLDHTPSSPYVVELYARVLAHLGNVARVLEDLPKAGQLLTHARHLLARHGPAEPAVLAEVDHLEASLRRDERRLPESMELLTRAVERYREAGLTKEAASALLTLGLTHREAGELEAAQAVTRQALAALDPAVEPRLALMARHNLALTLSDGGRHREARLVLPAMEPAGRSSSERRSVMNCLSNPKRLSAIALALALLLPATPVLAAPAATDSPLAWLTASVQKLVGWTLGWWGAAPADSWNTEDGAGMAPLGEPTAGGSEESVGVAPGGSPVSSSSVICSDAGPGMDPNGHCSS